MSTTTTKRRVEWACFLPSDGSNSRLACFTEQEAQWIVRLYAFGFSVEQLASLYDCVDDTIKNVVTGKRYSKQTERVRRKYLPAK